jgi:hypothetical protein
VLKERPERVGLADMHGNTTWFSGPDVGELPRAVILKAGCNANLRRRLAVDAEHSALSVLAATPATGAVWGRWSLALDQPDEGLVPFKDWDATVASDRATVAWAAIDVAELTAGNHGEIKLELFDGHDNLVAEPLVEEFIVVIAPSFSPQLEGV